MTPENRLIGDLMILQALADSEHVNEQEREVLTRWMENAGLTVQAAPGVPAATAPEVTDAMVDAYLRANDAYWKRMDELPTPPDKWRTGTPREATRESLRAALAAGVETVKGAAMLSAEELRQALNDAATSLETLATLSGRKTYGNPPIETYMDTFMDVRTYAAARAKAAREALATYGVPVAGKDQP